MRAIGARGDIVSRILKERRDRRKRDGLPCLMCDRKGTDYPCDRCAEMAKKYKAAWADTFPRNRET